MSWLARLGQHLNSKLQRVRPTRPFALIERARVEPVDTSEKRLSESQQPGESTKAESQHNPSEAGSGGLHRKQGDRRKPRVSGRERLVEQLRREEEHFLINPAQDFSNGKMYFAARIDGQLHLVDSDRNLVDVRQTQGSGLLMRHTEIDTTRFSPGGLADFLEGHRCIRITELYERIHDYIGRYVFFTDRRWIHFLTLWVIGTYVFAIFSHYPYVWLNAEKGSGKSLLMKVLSRVAFNGEVLIHPTIAVVFRDVSYNSITMFIDEVEQLRKQDKEAHSAMISLLNTGFEKSGFVKRMEKGKGGKFLMKSFSTYSPKMFAGINELDDVLQDRTVKIKLLRKKDIERVARYKETEALRKLQRSIRDDLYVFALTWAIDIARTYNESESTIRGISHLSNRELDIWEPMFLLANIVDTGNGHSEITNEMAVLSEQSMKEKQEDSVATNETYKLLSTTRRMLEEMSPLTSKDGVLVFEAGEVLRYFQRSEEFGWIERRNSLTVRLKKVDIKSERIRRDGSKLAVYRIVENRFVDLCERFEIG